MKVLCLTWEFPPLISGGLGTACYGMNRALLEQGVAIDMVMPTEAEVWFPLRKSEDVDHLPMAGLSTAMDLKAASGDVVAGGLAARLKAVGLLVRPESYGRPKDDPAVLWEESTPSGSLKTGADRAAMLDSARKCLAGPSDLLGRVWNLTTRMGTVAQQLDFDVIHVHDWLTYPAGLALAELTGKPLVAHIHATEFDRAGGDGDPRIHHLEYLGLTGADKVVAVSRYTAQMVIDRYAVDPAKVSVVYNAFNIPPVSLEDKKKLFKGPMVLFLGRITIQKGPDYFLEVARLVLESNPRVHFVMAGSGDMMQAILHKSAGMRLRQHFLFTDFLNREQVERVLKAADIFVMPSVSEPFGIVPLEAMAHGAVAIISKSSGVAELLKNAYKVDFWDVKATAGLVNRLIANDEGRLAMARAGQEEVMGIQWSEAAKKLGDLYGQVVYAHQVGGEPC